MQKIPTTIITGFLGAGKTSLITHLLQQNPNMYFAFIINEFGDIGLDKDMVLGCGDENCGNEDIIELANGCICCAVADDFLPSMEKILSREKLPDHIIIETSGLALPKPLLKAFTWQDVQSRATIDAVIALADCAALRDGYLSSDMQAVQAQNDSDDKKEHDDPIEEVFEDQLLCADIILLNKTDVCSESEIAQVKTHIGEHARAETIILPISLNKDINITRHVFGLNRMAEHDVGNRPSHHDDADDHDHDDFDSFMVSCDDIDNIAILEHKVQQLRTKHNIIRIKGFLHIKDKPMRMVFHMAGGRINYYFDRLWQDDENKESQLIIIGLKGLDQNAITHLLQS